MTQAATAPTRQEWDAPTADRPITARVVVPGSKSITNRALILAALANRQSTLRRPLVARDTRLMADALRALGTSIATYADRIVVTPVPLAGPALIDCGLAGTVMRFMPAVAALADEPVSFVGDARARERPMREVLDALRALGVRVTGDRIPFSIEGTGSVAGGVVTIDAAASSQFVSGLLLAGSSYAEGVDVRHHGKPMPSQPHVEMTVAMLRDRGVEVDDNEPDRWVVTPGPVGAKDVDIEPDLSNAAPFLAAAAVTAGRVTIAGWPQATTQAGDRLRELLSAMGCKIEHDSAGLTLTGPDRLAGVDIDLHDVGELAPVMASVAALADGPSYLRGIAHLRGHETDRLAAIECELGVLGCDIRQTEDGLTVRPRPLSADPDRVFRTYADHRMAQAGAVIGLVVAGVRLDDVATTSKTHPDFVAAWAAMLGREPGR